jgi:hypothetical protein
MNLGSARVTNLATLAVGVWAQVRYRYPNRLLFIAGLPKSGTEWLKAMLEAVPGYQRMPYHDPDGTLLQHRLTESLLRSCPAYGYFVWKTHVQASPEVVAAVRNTATPTVVMWRDLRDQAVSRYYHVIHDASHRHHQQYVSVSRDEGVEHSAMISATEYADWIRSWQPLVKNEPDRFLLVRYEDLRKNADDQLRKSLVFLGIEASDEERAGFLADAAKSATQGADFSERLQNGVTFRAGRIGDWRSHFSAKAADNFKRLAGDLLVDLEYEHDLNWSADR